MIIYHHRTRKRAFSLIELMVVMVILIILIGLVVPAFHNIGRSGRLTNAGMVVMDQIKLARQLAVAQNRKVDVRFYKLKGETGTTLDYRALRIFVYDEEGQNPTAFGALKSLPFDVIMITDDKYSTLLSSANVTPAPGTDNLPDAPNTPYKMIQFGPTGGTNLDSVNGALGGDKWFLTLKTEVDPKAGDMPAKNFVTIVIDPVTGRLKSFQP